MSSDITREAEAFPSRLLKASSLESLEAVEPPRPDRINEHLQVDGGGRPRAMSDDEIASTLSDPLAMLVLRQGVFPKSLDELLEALDAHNQMETGLPEQSTFLVSEGGQIRFEPGVAKGGTRLLTVRSREGTPELMISTLIPPGVNPRSSNLLNEVIAWDPVNQTFHFYQRQEGLWFWCGQSDMALEAPTRGHGPFDSHVNGYVLMKELRSPWVHWHGPGLGIAETAFAPDDPLVRDPLFVGRDNALNFEMMIVRPLAERWNAARFEKAVNQDGSIALLPYARQIVDSTTANLISTHKEWSRIDGEGDLDDLPATFFIDVDGLIDSRGVGLSVSIPTLRMSRQRYKQGTIDHDLRLLSGSLNIPGDVPFCFTVPERAFEDTLALWVLLQRQVMSPRLAGALLMVDFANPIGSPQRASLLAHLPARTSVGGSDALDELVVNSIRAAAESAPEGAAESEFLAGWDLGPDAWRDAYADRIENYLEAVAARLETDEGADDVFRLAESRRRDFRRKPLAEFGLSLPRALAIPDTSPSLRMTIDAQVQ